MTGRHSKFADINIPADLAPAHDCPKIVVSLWRQRDFMWQTTIQKNIRLTVACNPYRVLCCKTRRTNKVAFSLHRMRDLTASLVAVSKSKPVCSHLHCWLRMYLNNKPWRLPWTWERMLSGIDFFIYFQLPSTPHHVLQYWRMVSQHITTHPTPPHA